MAAEQVAETRSAEAKSRQQKGSANSSAGAEAAVPSESPPGRCRSSPVSDLLAHVMRSCAVQIN